MFLQRCEECDKDFKFVKEFHFHRAVNHKESIIKIGNKLKSETTDSQTTTANTTTSTTPTNKTTTSSNNGAEVLTDFEPTMIYKCRHCDKTFKWLSVLKKHADTHREKLNNKNNKQKGGEGGVVAGETETEEAEASTTKTAASTGDNPHDQLQEVPTNSNNDSSPRNTNTENTSSNHNQKDVNNRNTGQETASIIISQQQKLHCQDSETTAGDNNDVSSSIVDVTAMDIDEITTTKTTPTTSHRHQVNSSPDDHTNVKTFADTSNASIVKALLQQRQSSTTTTTISAGEVSTGADSVESVILERLNAATAGGQLSFHTHIDQGSSGVNLTKDNSVTTTESADSPAIVCYVTEKGEVLTTADHDGGNIDNIVSVGEELNILACGHCLAGFTDEGELNRHVITEHSDLIGIDTVEKQQLLLRQQLAVAAASSASSHGAAELIPLSTSANDTDIVTAPEIDQRQHVTASEFSTTSGNEVITTSVVGTSDETHQLLTQQHVTVEAEDGTAIHVLDGTEGIKIIQLAMEAKQELEALERQKQRQQHSSDVDMGS